MYFQALPLYARNLGVLLAPLIAAAIGIGLRYAAGPLFAGVGGAGFGIIAFIIQVLYGYAFAVSVIFADDAWRHGRGNLRSAWDQAGRRAGNIIISVIGFYFLIYVAGLIGSIGGPILSEALSALAVWAFIYAIPAAAIGGVPSGASFSASLQAARRHPLATAILVIVSLVVYYGLTIYAPAAVGPYVGAGYDVATVLLTAIALGYIALVIARQYADFAFRFW
jgi:cation transport ATPase